MKAAAISLSTLNKYRRWDAGYFLGEVEEKEQAVSRAQVQLQIASTSLLNRTKELVDTIQRRDTMIANGEVIPIDFGSRIPSSA